MKKFLVTGAAGFIGLNLTKFLLEKGYAVKGIDNFCTSCFSIYDKELNKLIYNNLFSFEALDCCSNKVLDVVKLYKPDYIIHLAAIPSVSRSIKNPKKSIKNNVISTTNIALAGLKYKFVKRIIYVGSSSYYGGRSRVERQSPNETYPLCKSPYAASKAAGELILKSFVHSYGVSSIVLRLHNVFGPMQNPYSQYSAVIPAFINNLLKGESPIIFGSGLQSRDFTYVDNVSHAILLSCIKENIYAGYTYDVGCGKSTTLLQLLSIIQKELNIFKDPIFKWPRTGDVAHSQADLWCTKYGIDYEPIVSLEKGIEKTANYYSSLL